MRNLILASIIIILTGCGKGYDAVGCYETVVNKYPNAKIVRLPLSGGPSNYTFLVRLGSNEVRVVKTMNTKDTNITYDEVLFEAN